MMVNETLNETINATLNQTDGGMALPDPTELRESILGSLWNLMVQVVMAVLDMLGLPTDPNTVSWGLLILTIYFLITNMARIGRLVQDAGKIVVGGILLIIVLQMMGVNVI